MSGCPAPSTALDGPYGRSHHRRPFHLWVRMESTDEQRRHDTTRNTWWPHQIFEFLFLFSSSTTVQQEPNLRNRNRQTAGPSSGRRTVAFFSLWVVVVTSHMFFLLSFNIYIISLFSSGSIFGSPSPFVSREAIHWRLGPSLAFLGVFF